MIILYNNNDLDSVNSNLIYSVEPRNISKYFDGVNTYDVKRLVINTTRNLDSNCTPGISSKWDEIMDFSHFNILKVINIYGSVVEYGGATLPINIYADNGNSYVVISMIGTKLAYQSTLGISSATIVLEYIANN